MEYIKLSAAQRDASNWASDDRCNIMITSRPFLDTVKYDIHPEHYKPTRHETMVELVKPFQYT